MSSGRRNGLLIVTLVAVALLAAGWFTIPLASPTLKPGQPPPNVVITLIPFIFILFGILLAFIAAVILLATLINNKLHKSLYRPIEIVLIAGIFIGLIGMIQPWVIDLYRLGFTLLFACTIGYIVWSHIVPRSSRPVDEVQTTVSAAELERQAAAG